VILIAIGANIPSSLGASPLETCRWAASALDNLGPPLARLRLRGLSRWYVTAPVPRSDQPDYINGVAHVCGSADPAALLGQLQRLEAVAGRRRGARNAPRPLDLDIIAMADQVLDDSEPVLPHPRAHERGFVLLPLRDVAPEWIHPRLRRPLEALISELPPQQVRAL
jgi:2-amino-4-hydroxy-6-hydroxymethyldihydropteridine diphosphokinase